VLTGKEDVDLVVALLGGEVDHVAAAVPVVVALYLRLAGSFHRQRYASFACSLSFYAEWGGLIDHAFAQSWTVSPDFGGVCWQQGLAGDWAIWHLLVVISSVDRVRSFFFRSEFELPALGQNSVFLQRHLLTAR